MSQQSPEEIQRKQIELHWLLSTTMQVDEMVFLKELGEHSLLNNLLSHLPIAEWKLPSSLNWNYLNHAFFALVAEARIAKGVI